MKELEKMQELAQQYIPIMDDCFGVAMDIQEQPNHEFGYFPVGMVQDLRADLKSVAAGYRFYYEELKEDLEEMICCLVEDAKICGLQSKSVNVLYKFEKENIKPSGQ